MTFPDWLEYIKNAAPVSLVTYILGFLTSRFTMTAKERADRNQYIYKNTTDLLEKQKERHQEFVAVLEEYCAAEGPPEFDEFMKLVNAGDRYFYQMQITSEAILGGNVSPDARDRTLVPKIKEAVDRLLPCFMETTIDIATKKGFDYRGQIRREDYESLYLVAEKYGKPSHMAEEAVTPEA